jgi:hypothetical protein
VREIISENPLITPVQHPQAVWNMERVYKVKSETMPSSLLFIHSFKVNSKGEQVDVAEAEGTMVQDYYLISASWKRDILEIELLKLRLPYSRPDEKDSLTEEVCAEERIKTSFNEAHSR